MTGYLPLAWSILPVWSPSSRNDCSSLRALLVVYAVLAFPPTFDMHMPTWPFFAVAWIGDAAAVLLIAIRTYRLIFHPEDMHDPKLKATE